MRRLQSRQELQGAFCVLRTINADDDVAELTNGSSDHQHCA
jgi:hypothetical protein